MNTRAYVTEFIGTFFLVLTIGLVVVGGPMMLGALAIGASLMIMVYMGGHISGGHYNPAVSLAAMLRGALPARELLPYIVSQILGAVVASLMVFLILGNTFAPAPAEGVSAGRALVVEFLFTFALALVVLNAATAPKTSGNSFYGLAIGFTVVVGAIAGGGISGGAYNPAVGTGPAIVHAIFGQGSVTHVWIYWVAPLAAGALAAYTFKFQNEIGQPSPAPARSAERVPAEAVSR